MNPLDNVDEAKMEDAEIRFWRDRLAFLWIKAVGPNRRDARYNELVLPKIGSIIEYLENESGRGIHLNSAIYGWEESGVTFRLITLRDPVWRLVQEKSKTKGNTGESSMKPLNNIDEMLAKLSKTEESAKDKVVNVSLVDLEKLLSAAGELAGQTINNPDWKRETLRGWADKVYDAIEPFEDLIKNIDFTYEPGEPPDVDEAKISMPQVIDQITRSLDDLAEAEDPHTSVDALRDIISAVAGGLIKLGEKKSAAALSKIAMEIQPSEEPAVAMSKESTSFTNI